MGNDSMCTKTNDISDEEDKKKQISMKKKL